MAIAVDDLPVMAKPQGPQVKENGNTPATRDLPIQTKDPEPILRQPGANIPPIRKLATKFLDQVVVITGAAQGIGAETADSFASQGATLVLVDLNETRLASTAQSLRDNYPATSITPLTCDLTKDDEVSTTITSIINSHRQIDILVHLAGIYPFKLITDHTFAEYEKVMQTNVNSTFSLTRHVLPHMRARGYGRIVNTSSGTAIRPEPMLGVYATSKAAVIGFTRATAVEAGPGITANVVAPGLIYNEHTWGDPMSQAVFGEVIKTQSVKRFGLPSDIAEIICFLASPETEFITGQVFDVGGGRTFY